jgi:hypothetical protein
MSEYVSANIPWFLPYFFGWGHLWLMVVDDLVVPALLLYAVYRAWRRIGERP